MTTPLDVRLLSELFDGVSGGEALADASVIGVIRPSLEDWLSGSGNTGAPNGTGNQDWDIGPDGIHPSKFGTIQQGALVHQRLGSMAA